MTRVTVDRQVCAGLGECEANAPAVFEVRDDGLVSVLVDKIPATDLDAVRAAVASCPTGALRLTPDGDPTAR